MKSALKKLQDVENVKKPHTQEEEDKAKKVRVKF